MSNLTQIKRLLSAFEQAAVQKSWAGVGDPEDHPILDRRYDQKKRLLLEAIESAINRGPSSSDAAVRPTDGTSVGQGSKE